ncbi:MAG: hypothetical protein R3C68_07165 [Myxococcota bacterium]
MFNGPDHLDTTVKRLNAIGGIEKFVGAIFTAPKDYADLYTAHAKKATGNAFAKFLVGVPGSENFTLTQVAKNERGRVLNIGAQIKARNDGHGPTDAEIAWVNYGYNSYNVRAEDQHTKFNERLERWNEFLVGAAIIPLAIGPGLPLVAATLYGAAARGGLSFAEGRRGRGLVRDVGLGGVQGGLFSVATTMYNKLPADASVWRAAKTGFGAGAVYNGVSGAANRLFKPGTLDYGWRHALNHSLDPGYVVMDSLAGGVAGAGIAVILKEIQSFFDKKKSSSGRERPEGNRRNQPSTPEAPPQSPTPSPQPGSPALPPVVEGGRRTASPFVNSLQPTSGPLQGTVAPLSGPTAVVGTLRSGAAPILSTASRAGPIPASPTLTPVNPVPPVGGRPSLPGRVGPSTGSSLSSTASSLTQATGPAAGITSSSPQRLVADLTQNYNEQTVNNMSIYFGALSNYEQLNVLQMVYAEFVDEFVRQHPGDLAEEFASRFPTQLYDANDPTALDSPRKREAVVVMALRNFEFIQQLIVHHKALQAGGTSDFKAPALSTLSPAAPRVSFNANGVSGSKDVLNYTQGIGSLVQAAKAPSGDPVESKEAPRTTGQAQSSPSAAPAKKTPIPTDKASEAPATVQVESTAESAATLGSSTPAAAELAAQIAAAQKEIETRTEKYNAAKRAAINATTPEARKKAFAARNNAEKALSEAQKKLDDLQAQKAKLTQKQPASAPVDAAEKRASPSGSENVSGHEPANPAVGVSKQSTREAQRKVEDEMQHKAEELARKVALAEANFQRRSLRLKSSPRADKIMAKAKAALETLKNQLRDAVNELAALRASFNS